MVEQTAIAEALAVGDELILFTQVSQSLQEDLIFRCLSKIFPKLGTYRDSELNGRHFFNANKSNYIIRDAFKNTPHNRNIVKKHLAKSDRNRHVQMVIGYPLFHFWTLGLSLLLLGKTNKRPSLQKKFLANATLSPVYFAVLYVLYESGIRTGGIRLDIFLLVPCALLTLTISLLALIDLYRLRMRPCDLVLAKEK
jgi:hypothetical protein